MNITERLRLRARIRAQVKELSSKSQRMIRPLVKRESSTWGSLLLAFTVLRHSREQLFVLFPRENENTLGMYHAEVVAQSAYGNNNRTIKDFVFEEI